MERPQRRTEIRVDMTTPKNPKGCETPGFLLLSPGYPEVQRTTKPPGTRAPGASFQSELGRHKSVSR